MDEILSRYMTGTSEALSSEDYEQSKCDAYNALPGDMTGPDCPVCRNKGMVAELAEGYMLLRECSCMTRRRALKRLERSGLKDVIGRYTFARFHAEEPWQQSMKAAAARYAEERRGWFCVSGTPGSGKTHISTAVCAELLDAGYPVRYFLWRSEAPRLKASARTEEYEEAVRPYKTVKVLYIDDFWKGNVTEADINLAFDILNARYNDTALLTILSSELSIPKMLSVDEAIGSRIYERCAGNYVNVSGEGKNWRLR